MSRHLAKIVLSQLLAVCIAIIGIFGFNVPAQALELETQDYFIKQITRDKVLAVSPNFRGQLTQASLLPSLTEISEKYHIKATKSIEAQKLNGKLVPGLIVYVESKSALGQSGSIVANKP